MNILYVASEARPFAASGGLADVAGSLPQALCARGVDCRVVMPLYGSIGEQWRRKMTFVTNFEVNLGWRKQYCGIFECVHNGVTFYFIDNEFYFKREGALYGFGDDAERYAFFSKAVLDMLLRIDFVPDVINCNDWQSALIPVYLNLYFRQNEQLKATRTVFTIHNIQYQGQYGMELLGDQLGLPDSAAHIMEYDGCLNMMKGAMTECDMITTVSPTYAQEIMDPWYSFGLDRFLKEHSYKLTGILNGIDQNTNNPETDPNLFANFSAKTLDKGKAVCKAELQKLMGLEEKPDRILIGLIARLVSQKGLDLVKYILDDMMTNDISLVVLGSGDKMYEEFFLDAQARYPGRVAVRIGFLPDLAAKIYSGADAFLMPSKTEPCGLAQMVSLRYGTLPIVRETGGLKDSIKDMGGEDGNGFSFQSYNAHDMQDAVLRCKALYDQPKEWKKAVKHAMACDFSWDRSAGDYLAVYNRVLGK